MHTKKARRAALYPSISQDEGAAAEARPSRDAALRALRSAGRDQLAYVTGPACRSCSISKALPFQPRLAVPEGVSPHLLPLSEVGEIRRSGLRVVVVEDAARDHGGAGAPVVYA